MSNTLLAGLVGFLIGIVIVAAASNSADDRTAARGFDRIGDQLFCRVIDPPAECRP